MQTFKGGGQIPNNNYCWLNTHKTEQEESLHLWLLSMCLLPVGLGFVFHQWNTPTPSHVPKHIELLMKYWLSVPTHSWCSISHVLPLWVLRSNRSHACSAGNRGCSLRSWWKLSSISGFWRRVTGVSWTAWSHLPWIWWTSVSQSQTRLLMLHTAALQSRPWPHHYHELLSNVMMERKWGQKDDGI